MFYRIVFSIFCVASGQLLAATIYTNLGPNDENNMWSSTSRLVGVEFTTTGAGALSTISLPVSVPGGIPLALTMALYSDAGGQPGSLLESWTADAPATTAAKPQLTVLTSVVKPIMSPDTTYWFFITQNPYEIQWATGAVGNDEGIWAGDSLDSLTNIPGLTMAGIQLDSFEEVTQTPEPASAVLLFLALTCCYLSRRRHPPLLP